MPRTTRWLSVGWAIARQMLGQRFDIELGICARVRNGADIDNDFDIRVTHNLDKMVQRAVGMPDSENDTGRPGCSVRIATYQAERRILP